MIFGLSDTVTVSPTRLDVADWVMEANCLPEQMVCNAWMKKGYAWFANGEEVEGRNGECKLVVTIFFYDANVDSFVDLNEFEGEV